MSLPRVFGDALSPDRWMRPKRANPAEMIRSTYAEVSLPALRHNFKQLQKAAQGAVVWPVLKADAYGHGAPGVARTLERAGAPGFCVALPEEGIELRTAGIRAPVLVMGGTYGRAHEAFWEHGLTPVVWEFEDIARWAQLVRSGRVSGPIEVHLKVDTGMARLGVTLAQLPALAERLRDVPEVRVKGLMTHFACAEASSLDPTRQQLSRFAEASAVLARHGIQPTVRHAANSAALLRGQGLFEAVRPGLAVFGLSSVPSSAVTGEQNPPLSAQLHPALRLCTEVVALRELQVGEAAGYGSTWRAQRSSRLATLALGYADGVRRHLSNRGQVLLRGARAPMVGAVSMDLLTVDVTDLPGVELGEEAVLLGGQTGPCGSERISVEEVAAQADTIVWEVLTSLARRVPRIYRDA